MPRRMRIGWQHSLYTPLPASPGAFLATGNAAALALGGSSTFTAPTWQTLPAITVPQGGNFDLTAYVTNPSSATLSNYRVISSGSYVMDEMQMNNTYFNASLSERWRSACNPISSTSPGPWGDWSDLNGTLNYNTADGSTNTACNVPYGQSTALTIMTYTDPPQEVTINVTTLVNDWLANGNKGIMLRGTQIRMASRSNSNTAVRPYILVDGVRCDCSADCVVDGGANGFYGAEGPGDPYLGMIGITATENDVEKAAMQFDLTPITTGTCTSAILHIWAMKAESVQPVQAYRMEPPVASSSQLPSGVTLSSAGMLSATSSAPLTTVSDISFAVDWNISTGAIQAGVFLAVTGPNDASRGLTFESGCKHVTATVCAADGSVFFNNGDYRGQSPYTDQSYQQGTYRLDVAARLNSTDVNAGWSLEYPFEGYGGTTVQPKGPDFCAFTWDATRNIFWFVPGQQEYNASNFPLVPYGETLAYQSDTNFIYSAVMAFDPSAAPSARWSVKCTTSGPTPAETWFSIYDSVNDRLIRPGYSGGSGGIFDIYNCTTNTWSTSVGMGTNALGNDILVSKEYHAVDPTSRRAYTIDAISGRLHRWSLDTLAMEDLGVTPLSPFGIENYMYLVWDSHNSVVIWFAFNNEVVVPYVYHPTTATWEAPSYTTNPAGTPVYGRVFAYVPSINATLIIGQGTSGGVPNFLLYRYA